MHTASRTAGRRAAVFGAIGAVALLPAAAGWLMDRGSRPALAQDRGGTDRAAPLVPGEQRYFALEFAAAVVVGPNEGLALEGTLLLKDRGATGRLEGILLKPDGTLFPVFGQLLDPDGKLGLRLLVMLTDAVLDLSGTVDIALVPDPTETRSANVPRVRIVGFGFMSGPTDDDRGIWSFEGENTWARATGAARSDDRADVDTWAVNPDWGMPGDGDLSAVDELLND